MRIPRATLVGAAIGAITLTGCGSLSPSEEDPPPSPTAIAKPEPWTACDVRLNTSIEESPALTRATVQCGDVEHRVSGDFGKRVMNRYDPATTGGINRIVNDDKAITVWVTRDEGDECLIYDPHEGDDLSDCEMIEK